MRRLTLHNGVTASARSSKSFNSLRNWSIWGLGSWFPIVCEDSSTLYNIKHKCFTTWIAGSLDCSVLLDCRCSFLMNKPSMGSKTTYVFPQFHVHCTTKSNLKKTINYLKALASARSRKWAWILNRIRLLWVVVIFAARRPCNRLCRVNLNWFIATISILSHFKGNLSNKQFNKTTKYSYVG